MLKRLLVVFGIVLMCSVVLADAPEIRALFPKTVSIGDKLCILAKNLAEECEDLQNTKTYKLFNRITEWFWLEVIVDACTFGLFAWATLKALNILVP